MIGFDGIGFHAIAEMITGALPAISYNLPSRISGISQALYFQRGVEVTTTQPTVTTSTVQNALWDNDTIILWDNDTNIEWDV